jgi:hypothetical protein
MSFLDVGYTHQQTAVSHVCYNTTCRRTPMHEPRMGDEQLEPSTPASGVHGVLHLHPVGTSTDFHGVRQDVRVTASRT